MKRGQHNFNVLDSLKLSLDTKNTNTTLSIPFQLLVHITVVLLSQSCVVVKSGRGSLQNAVHEVPG